MEVVSIIELTIILVCYRPSLLWLWCWWVEVVQGHRIQYLVPLNYNGTCESNLF